MLCCVGYAKKDSSQLDHSTQFVRLSIFLFIFLSSCLCIPPDFLFCCISFPQRPILIVDCLNAIYMVLFCHSFSFFPLEFRQRYTFLDAELVLMWSHVYFNVEKSQETKQRNKDNTAYFELGFQFLYQMWLWYVRFRLCHYIISLSVCFSK